MPVAPFAAVGVVVARRVPGNPIGWIMIALALSLMLSTDIGFYAVRAYRVDHHSLPLSRVAVFLAVGWIWMIVLLPLPIALFPDGRLASRRWRWTLPAYALVTGALLVGFYWQDIAGIGARHLKIDSSGELAGFGSSADGLGAALDTGPVSALRGVVRCLGGQAGTQLSRLNRRAAPAALVAAQRRRRVLRRRGDGDRGFQPAAALCCGC